MHIPCQHHLPVDTHYTGVNEKLVTLGSLDPVTTPDNDMEYNHPIACPPQFLTGCLFSQGKLTINRELLLNFSIFLSFFLSLF